LPLVRSVQFSLFGAAATEPVIADLAGVALAGGHWVRSGSSARLSVVVDAGWRAEALGVEFDRRGVGARNDAVVPAAAGRAVRTAFTPSLAPMADAWTHGAAQSPPADLTLTAGGLRLWAIAAGHRDGAGFVLRTRHPDDPVHRAAGAQLARLTMTAVALTTRGGGPGWRIASERRLRRLAELLGEPPDGALRDWPC
jgi:hypothetical protein